MLPCPVSMLLPLELERVEVVNLLEWTLTLFVYATLAVERIANPLPSPSRNLMMLVTLISLLAWTLASACGSANNASCSDGSSYRVTALVGFNNASTLACWSLSPPFTVSGGVKIQSLGDIAGSTYSVFPVGPPIDAGTHTAPNLQYFVIIQGGATISFPTNNQILRVQSDEIYIAADGPSTSALGHHTVVDGGSKILQLPFANEVIPAHTSVPGSCNCLP